MKKLTYILTAGLIATSSLLLLFAFSSPTPAPAESVKWYQVTVIESVVPGRVGRSKMISQDENGKMDETKLQNFFSMAEINFGNVMENDQKITNKITDLTNKGWTLHDVTSGVYGGNGNNNGIFITRYLFRKTEIE